MITWANENVVFAYVGSIEHRRMRWLRVDSSQHDAGQYLNRITVRLARIADGRPLWITQPLKADDSGAVRFLVAHADTIALIGTVAHSPWQLQAVGVSAPDEVVVAAPRRWIEGRDSLFATLLLRVRVDCA